MHDRQPVRVEGVGLRLFDARLCLAALLVLSTTVRGDDSAKRHVDKYASRLFLADGRVVDVAGARSLAIPSGESSDVVSLRMPSGRIMQASSRSEPVWETFELRLTSGDVSLVLRGTIGFGKESLPDGLMLRLKDTTYRWLAYAYLPSGPSEVSATKRKMQAAVEKLPQDFLSDLALFASLPASGLDSSVFFPSHFYILLSELLPDGLTPVNVNSTQRLEPEVAAKLLESR